jgi:hypothetical protein
VVPFEGAVQGEDDTPPSGTFGTHADRAEIIR